MYLIFGEWNGNSLLADREYSRHYSSRHSPNAHMIRSVSDRLRNTGIVYQTNNLHDVDGRTHCALTSAQEDALLFCWKNLVGRVEYTCTSQGDECEYQYCAQAITGRGAIPIWLQNRSLSPSM
ncbi:hypothetical protein CDAR_10271 [Caerostris darwini]|uniref:Uncharacterized protein n=1 Tax=Caerostris darwini TaxID=1538125 RepID=A0AAV4RB84_9ARAC|nr:hypothetical protein CDAR_10271 [Caerostris darwini]